MYTNLLLLFHISISLSICFSLSPISISSSLSFYSVNSWGRRMDEISCSYITNHWYSLLRVAARCSAIQCVAESAACCLHFARVAVCCCVWQCIAVCCSVLQWVAAYGSVLQCLICMDVHSQLSLSLSLSLRFMALHVWSRSLTCINVRWQFLISLSLSLSLYPTYMAKRIWTLQCNQPQLFVL